MLFNSLDFVFFILIFYSLYWFFSSQKSQNILIVIGSYIFYGWWDWRFLGLIVFSTLLDYTPTEKIVINYTGVKSNFSLNNENRLEIENDYTKQSDKLSDLQHPNYSYSISDFSKEMIESIQILCQKYNINLIFLIGPNVCSECEISLVTNFFTQQKINFSDEFYVLNNQSIGNRFDHVNLEYKKESTKFYKDIIIKKWPELFPNENVY